MAKKIQAYIKLQVKAQDAKPSALLSTALGQHGVNIVEFCRAFNAQTQSIEKGVPVPVVVTAYSDSSFTFVMKRKTAVKKKTAAKKKVAAKKKAAPKRKVTAKKKAAPKRTTTTKRKAAPKRKAAAKKKAAKKKTAGRR